MKHHTSSNKGFTLIEVVVSLALIAMLSVGFFYVVNTALNIQKNNDTYGSLTNKTVNALQEQKKGYTYTGADFKDLTFCFDKKENGETVGYTNGLYASPEFKKVQMTVGGQRQDTGFFVSQGTLNMYYPK